MKEKTILVIDDSATIRRLCDSELSRAGYHVLLAPTAEEGVRVAREELPNLIILDHQLPGTTGYEVCRELLSMVETARIPVVASSTLRKKAYAEYVDCDNVVDMLPKPYTADVLIATIENSIDTAAMVVQSQTDGSSVPEVIGQVGESDLSGMFGCFGLREILDLLNNGMKVGMIEVEMESCRVFIYVDRGRIQAVTASGVDPAIIARRMPAGLSELTPVIKLTVAGRRGSEVDGLLELLNNKVLDPRLLKKLLRLQAAVLLRICFTGQLKSFRFERNQTAPPLFQKLPLDSSLLSFLVEGALICDQQELPTCERENAFVRRAIRGQNLDRAGLSSRHMKLTGLLGEPITVQRLVEKLGWPKEEVVRVLHGFELAELTERVSVSQRTKVYSVISNSPLVQKVESIWAQHKDEIDGESASDWMALRVLLRRQSPAVLLIDMDDETTFNELSRLIQEPGELLTNVKFVGVRTGGADGLAEGIVAGFQKILKLDCSEQELVTACLGMNQPSAQSNPLPHGENLSPTCLEDSQSHEMLTCDSQS